MSILLLENCLFCSTRDWLGPVMSFKRLVMSQENIRCGLQAVMRPKKIETFVRTHCHFFHRHDLQVFPTMVMTVTILWIMPGCLNIRTKHHYFLFLLFASGYITELLFSFSYFCKNIYQRPNIVCLVPHYTLAEDEWSSGQQTRLPLRDPQLL